MGLCVVMNRRAAVEGGAEGGEGGKEEREGVGETVVDEEELEVVYANPKKLDHDQYHIGKAVCDGVIELNCTDSCGVMDKNQVDALSSTRATRLQP